MVELLPTEKEMRDARILRHGDALQRRFEAASVAVCGLGGLGSNIAIALARAGIGRLHLIDFDRVDITNLHRQQYAAHQLGLCKTEALKANLLAISPYLDIRTDTVRITEKNLHTLLNDDEIICEAFDGAEQKAMLVNSVLELFPRKYLVAASGMAGLSSGNSIQTRKITEHFYLCGDETSDVAQTGSLFASRVMICAAHQAHTVLRIIAGETTA